MEITNIVDRYYIDKFLDRNLDELFNRYKVDNTLSDIENYTDYRNSYFIDIFNNASMFCDEITYIINSKGTNVVDVYNTYININKFIKWAVLKNIALPDEMLNIVLRDSPVGQSPLPVKTLDQIVDEKVDQYCFKKMEKGWHLKFGDLELKGVKDWTGMSYVHMLLRNPSIKIGVLALQKLEITSDGIPEPDIDMDSDNERHSDSDQDGANKAPCKNDLWKQLDPRAIQESKSRLEAIENQLESMRGSNIQNRSKIERLEKEQAEIEKYLKQANYRPKDPAIEKVRKNVLKAITDTISKIRKLEDISGYNDKVISSHLIRFIKTGSYCSYNINKADSPPWQL
jgi:hypothetical protein